MISFAKFLVEAAGPSSNAEVNTHLWHLNELVLLEKDGVERAKITLKNMLDVLKDPLESNANISLKLDGSISITFGYVTDKVWCEALEEKKKKSKSDSLPDIEKALSKLNKNSTDSRFVVGYKGALKKPQDLYFDKEGIENSDKPLNVKDILKIILKNKDILKPNNTNSVFLVQCDVMFHSKTDQTHPSKHHEKEDEYLSTPNLITYKTKKPSNNKYLLGIGPHTLYKDFSLTNIKAKGLTSSEIEDIFTVSSRESFSVDSIINFKKKDQPKENIELNILGNKNVYVLNYDLRTFLSKLPDEARIQEEVYLDLLKKVSRYRKKPELDTYYDIISTYKKLSGNLQAYVNNGIAHDELTWNNDTKKFESKWFTYGEYFETLKRRKDIAKSEGEIKSTKAKNTLDDLFYKSIYKEQLPRIIQAVLSTYLELMSLKQICLTYWHQALERINWLSSYFYRFYDKKMIPIGHEGIVVHGVSDSGEHFMTKAVSQHEFSRLNFTAKTQSHALPPLTLKENFDFLIQHNIVKEKFSDKINFSAVKSIFDITHVYVFAVGRFNPPTIGHVTVFNKLNDFITEYGVPEKNVHLVATHSVSEAKDMKKESDVLKDPIPFEDKKSILNDVKKDYNFKYQINDKKITANVVNMFSVCEALGRYMLSKHNTISEMTKIMLQILNEAKLDDKNPQEASKDNRYLMLYVAGAEYNKGAEENTAKGLQSIANSLGIYFSFVSAGERVGESSSSNDADLIQGVNATDIRTAIKNDTLVTFKNGTQKDPIDLLAGKDATKNRTFNLIASILRNKKPSEETTEDESKK